jgi:osmoprotectant transport system permease protein
VNGLASAWNWLTGAQQWHGPDGIPARLLEHAAYTGISLAIAVAIALPAGLWLGHTRRGGFISVSAANLGRALPTLGLLVLAFTVSSASSAAWLVPLVVLGIPPVLVNAYEGVLGVDPGLRDAAAGMGMTGRQVLLQVEAPVAVPLIIVGIRTAAIQVVATATIAAYIGLGGLGRYIIDGLATDNYGEVAGGALFVVLLALAVQAIFVGVRRLAVPAGLRQQARQT